MKRKIRCRRVHNLVGLDFWTLDHLGEDGRVVLTEHMKSFELLEFIVATNAKIVSINRP